MKHHSRLRGGLRSPLTLLFFPLFAAVALLHLTLLRLPYFWDEGGYYIPAAWDFFRLGTLIPESTLSNAHPPLPSILLAAWWKLTGFHILSTRLFICLITTFALLAVYRIAHTLTASHTAAVALVILTAIYPVWFAQSTLAHADIFAAAFTLWALSFYFQRDALNTATSRSFRRDLTCTAIFFSLSVLAKETAILIPAIIAAYEIYLLIRERGPATGRRLHLATLAALTLPAILLAAWYAYHRAKTGFIFGNPEFLRYNATANLGIHRTLLSLRHRFVHLSFHLNLYIPLALTLAVLLIPKRRDTQGNEHSYLPQRATAVIVILILANWIAFSILGGAVLTRYLLPVYPLLLLLYIAAWRQRVRQWPWLAALTLIGFAVACEINPFYPFAPEDNLAYRDMIVLHQHAIDIIAKHWPDAHVLTAWPVTNDLARPELGYVTRPIAMTPIDNFSLTEIEKAAANPGDYDTAIIFSTKYNPANAGLHAGAGDIRYFDFHTDMVPSQVAALLHGDIVWQAEIKGQWAAVIRFPRSVLASRE